MSDHGDFNPPPGVLLPVAPGVRRILARNPSEMTFRGTNTYVVGQGDVALIDPGPPDSAHFAAIQDALCGERVSHVFVTHAHLDHSPAAALWHSAYDVPVLAFGAAHAGRSAVMARLAETGLAGGGEGVDSAFAPTRVLADGERVAGSGWALEALHTPGHMSNHMCFAFGDLLFTGDHVMGWSSSLISPPDGDLGAFMASCARLRRRAPGLLLPGHGAPVPDGAARLDALIAHRQGRTRDIFAALGPEPQSIAQITRQVYRDLPPGLLPAAERNVFAHLIDTVEKNMALPVPDLASTSHFRKHPDL